VVESYPFADVPPSDELWIVAMPSNTAGAIAEDWPGTGAMLARVEQREADEQTEQIPLPLEHTQVEATIAGYISTVDVTQRFRNPFSQKIEAAYIFPLPHNAAVNEFVMTIGDRRIRGILREKDEAQRIYTEARAQGYRASLLVQHRPNVFEQKVANIEPGKWIDVTLSYVNTLVYRDGWYAFEFPTVVGPRYNPPDTKDPIEALPRTEHEPPARGTAVHYLEPNERSGHDIGITVNLDAGVAIEELASSHVIETKRTGETAATVTLATADTIPNRDFILRYRVAGEQIKSNLLTYSDQKTGQGYFTLMLYPPAELDRLGRQPMEMVFVVDCSGSMSGRPLEQAQGALLRALDHMQPTDRFQIIRFSNSASAFGDRPVPATAANLEKARAYVRGLYSDGGTEVLAGIRAALGFPHDPQRFRVVAFMTDGFIGNDPEVIGEVHRQVGDARIFSFGVGESVNRYLLEGMAKEGRGAAAFLGLNDSADEVMDHYFERISHPAMTDIAIDWRGMLVSDTYPARLPDLFVGRAIVVTGKYSGKADRIDLRGRAGAESVNVTLEPDYATDGHEGIGLVWARARIADLADQLTWTQDPDGELASAIRDTALAYSLVSDYTSFIAVDALERTLGTEGVTVDQAVLVPEGVKYETTVSER
jgi:Ca-activated chloride channel family protein